LTWELVLLLEEPMLETSGDGVFAWWALSIEVSADTFQGSLAFVHACVLHGCRLGNPLATLFLPSAAFT
jgi:hypothetical protein